MSRISEQRDVQDRLVNYLQGNAWQYLPPFDSNLARNNNERNPFLIDILNGQLALLNGWQATDARIEDVTRRLRLLPANIEGNEQFLKGLRGQWTTYDPTQQRELNLTLIDYEHPERNTFHFTQEMWFEDRDRRRMDMVLFINGLPVVLIENKAPTLPDAGEQGFRQVQETYTTQIPEFIKYPIPFAVCARGVEYGATWNPRTTAFYTWKLQTGATGLEVLGKSFFERQNILNILRDYTIFYRSEDTLQKYLMRPHQMRTVEKIVDRVIDGVHGAEATTGLEWHTQGSGKTLTMIVAAHLIRRQQELQNPTILIVVDRIELETQMQQNLEAFGFPGVVRAESRDHLRQLLNNDYRGLIVTTIHKFDRMNADACTRKNVVLLIDEAHRSQEGDLGVYMNAALPNAFKFGFTGTPIDKGKVGKGTFKLFGQFDPEGYHDKYSINESIEDGTTVPLYYTLAPTKVWLDKEQLETEFRELREEFFNELDEEGAESQEALSRILQRADKLMAVLKSPSRITAIAEHIAQHLQEVVLPLGFKAMVVAPDREACALYKQALDQLLPSEWSVVVYSPYHKDVGLLREYHLDDDEEKQVRRAFRDPARDPKILIVTEKLLTGYDAPVAYAMYLDKPLKDHTLLQAIARVNRPYPSKKSGLIVDYQAIFEDLQRALAFDQASITKGLIDLEKLKVRFTDLLSDAESIVAPISPHAVEGRTDRLLEYFFDTEAREHLFEVFGELQDAFEVLSPDAFLHPYLDRYAFITQLYQVVYAEFSPKAQQQRLERQLLNKTDALIREHVSADPVVSPMHTYPINRNLADVVNSDNVSAQVKVINLQRSLIATIEELGDEQPYLLSLSDAVEEVIQRLLDRQISAETALAEQLKNADRLIEMQDARSQSDLDNVAFSLNMVLRGSQQFTSSTDTLAQELAALLTQRQGWVYNERLEGQVRTDLYARLLKELPKPVNPQNARNLVNDLLRMHRTVM